MDERALGIILRARSLTETSLIVHWLTREHGRLATVAKGARRPKSPLRGKLDLFYVADFSFARSRRSELHALREVVLRETHPALRGDIDALQQASYCAALVEQTTELDTPLGHAFDLMSGLLRHLPESRPYPLTVFAFEAKLLTELGLSPAASRSPISGGARRMLARMIELDWPGLSPLKPNAAQVDEIRRFLRRFLDSHLGRVPDQRDAAVGADS